MKKLTKRGLIAEIPTHKYYCDVCNKGLDKEPIKICPTCLVEATSGMKIKKNLF